MNQIELKESICDLILELWKESPDMRFGQLLGNFVFDRLFGNKMDNKVYWLIFSIPDEFIKSRLEYFTYYYYRKKAKNIEEEKELESKFSDLQKQVYTQLLRDKKWVNKLNTIVKEENWVNEVFKEYLV